MSSHRTIATVTALVASTLLASTLAGQAQERSALPCNDLCRAYLGAHAPKNRFSTAPRPAPRSSAVVDPEQSGALPRAAGLPATAPRRATTSPPQPRIATLPPRRSDEPRVPIPVPPPIERALPATSAAVRLAEPEPTPAVSFAQPERPAEILAPVAGPLAAILPTIDGSQLTPLCGQPPALPANLLERVTRMQRLPEVYRDATTVAFVDGSSLTRWIFTLPDHPAHPSAACQRIVQDKDGTRLTNQQLCFADPAICNRLKAEIQAR